MSYSFSPMYHSTLLPFALWYADSFMIARFGKMSAFVFPYRLPFACFCHIRSASIKPISIFSLH